MPGPVMPHRTLSPTAPTILPLELRAVSYESGGKRLIKDLSFALEAGPSTVIIGPNGAGKSLLLRLCHGLLQPSTGEVIWHGSRDRDPSRHQTMVFQHPFMLRRSVAANVDYPLAVRKVPRAQRRTLVDDALEKTGLRRFAGHPARVLSLGEQQKLALARAWALSPEVLFLDEPTANLDPGATHAVEQVIAAFDAAGTKIVMTTHDLAQARRLADEVLFLHRGRLRERASADAFFTSPRDPLAQAFVRGELLLHRRGADQSVRRTV